ncbi:MAG: RNA polymerase sigma factor [Candidatus Brocadiae bacterium]|nr:RNA polymerase sigma factor [Candidatus Brocadiia bacterium]
MSNRKKRSITPRLLGRLLDEHARPMALLARQWCDSPDDIVQEALVKLVQQKTPPDNAVAWLYRVVRNLAISAARRDRRRQRREASVARMRQGWFMPSDGDRLDARAAAEAMRALPVEQREVIVARIWGGLTFEEIAQVMDCSSSAAHRRYRAGLSALRETLGAPCSENASTKTQTPSRERSRR